MEVGSGELEHEGGLEHERDLLRAVEVGKRQRRARVAAFHLAMGVPTAEVPTVPSDERVRLRLRLIAEEFFEALEACSSEAVAYTSTSKEFVDYAIANMALNVDLPAFVDALADIDYVVEGARLEFGVDGEPVGALVHAANMTKAGGPVRADGKRLKPPGFVPPDVAGELLRQGWKP